MVKLVAGLSIPVPIFRLNFITKLIFIHDILGKSYNPTNNIMDKNVYMFLHIPPLLHHDPLLI